MSHGPCAETNRKINFTDKRVCLTLPPTMTPFYGRNPSNRTIYVQYCMNNGLNVSDIWISRCSHYGDQFVQKLNFVKFSK